MASVWGIHDWDGLTHSPSGCGFYRIIMPLAELGRHDGWETGWRPGNPPPGERRDVIVGQRLDKSESLGAWRRLSARSRLVFDIDDDIWNIRPVNWNAYQSFGPAAKDAVSAFARYADVVTVSTEPLAAIMRRHNPNVRVLPNHVPGWLLGHDRPRRDGKVVLGWAGGSSHAEDLAMIAAPLRTVLGEYPAAELHLMGANFLPTLGGRGRYTDWLPVDETGAYYKAIDFDIALAPLTGTIFDESKCVDSGMRISTDRGVLEAGSLEPGIRVWRDGWRRIEAVARNSPRPGLLLRMADGYQLRLTREHRMFVNGGWMRADRIRPGDTIAMEAESAHSGAPVRVPWPADSRMSRAYKGRPAADANAFLTAGDGPKLDITPRWGRFLGAFAGDGSVGQATVVQISCDGQDQDWIDLLTDDLRAFGLNPRTEEIATFNGTVLRRRGIRTSSAHLLRVLASLRVTAPRPSGNPIRVPCVPEVIWRSPKPVVAEFLAAYFEADGHCTAGGVQVTSKTEQLIRDVQRLLLLFGITSAVRSQTYIAQNGYKGLHWTCTLRRREADVFAKEIGFRSQRKSGRLGEITGRPPSNAAMPMHWWRRVALIEECFVDPVDIQVEGSAFVLAGFVSHNSAVKALEAMALGIPVIASRCTPYRDVVTDGVTGYLAANRSEWRKRLRELTADADARREMGVKAREAARAHVIESGWSRWAAVYEELLLWARG